MTEPGGIHDPALDGSGELTGWVMRLRARVPSPWSAATVARTVAPMRWVGGDRPALLDEPQLRLSAMLLPAGSSNPAPPGTPLIERLRALPSRLLPTGIRHHLGAEWATIGESTAILDRFSQGPNGAVAAFALASEVDPNIGILVIGSVEPTRSRALDDVAIPLAARVVRDGDCVRWATPSGWSRTEELQVSSEFATILVQLREKPSQQTTLAQWMRELLDEGPFLRSYHEINQRPVHIKGCSAAVLRQFSWQPSGRGLTVTTLVAGLAGDRGFSLTVDEPADRDPNAPAVDIDEVLGWLAVVGVGVDPAFRRLVELVAEHGRHATHQAVAEILAAGGDALGAIQHRQLAVRAEAENAISRRVGHMLAAVAGLSQAAPEWLAMPSERRPQADAVAPRFRTEVLLADLVIGVGDRCIAHLAALAAAGRDEGAPLAQLFQLVTDHTFSAPGFTPQFFVRWEGFPVSLAIDFLTQALRCGPRTASAVLRASGPDWPQRGAVSRTLSRAQALSHATAAVALEFERGTASLRGWPSPRALRIALDTISLELDQFVGEQRELDELMPWRALAVMEELAAGLDPTEIDVTAAGLEDAQLFDDLDLDVPWTQVLARRPRVEPYPEIRLDADRAANRVQSSEVVGGPAIPMEEIEDLTDRLALGDAGWRAGRRYLVAFDELTSTGATHSSLGLWPLSEDVAAAGEFVAGAPVPPAVSPSLSTVSGILAEMAVLCGRTLFNPARDSGAPPIRHIGHGGPLLESRSVVDIAWLLSDLGEEWGDIIGYRSAGFLSRDGFRGRLIVWMRTTVEGARHLERLLLRTWFDVEIVAVRTEETLIRGMARSLERGVTPGHQQSNLRWWRARDLPEPGLWRPDDQRLVDFCRAHAQPHEGVGAPLIRYGVDAALGGPTVDRYPGLTFRTVDQR